MPSLSEIIHATIVEIIVAIIVAVSITVWGRFKDKWSWPTVILYSLVAIACVLYIFDRFSRPSPPIKEVAPIKEVVNEQNIESKIRDWLDTFNVKVQKISVVDHPDVYFGFLVTYEDGKKVAVSRSKALGHYLTIEASVAVSTEQKMALEKLTQPERDIFWEKLTLELSSSRVRAHGQWPLDLITVNRLIPINKDLTESILIDRLDDVHSDQSLIAG
jgi:hypothetical protein